MIGVEEYKILISPSDFKAALAPYGFTWSDTATDVANKVYHDSAKGHMVANSGAGTRGYFYLLFDNVSAGDLVEIEMSVKAVDGDAGTSKMPSIGIHMVDNATVDGSQAFVQQKFPMTSEWETLRFKHYCTETRRLRVDFGMYSAESGKFYMKFCRAKVTKLRA